MRYFAAPFPSSRGIVTAATTLRSDCPCAVRRRCHPDPSKQQSSHCSLAAAPPLNERRLSGKWAELRDLDLCERKEGRKEAKTGLVIIFSLPPSPACSSVRLLHSSSSFSPSPLNGCNDLSKKELLLLRLAGWLLLFNESGPPLLDSPPPFPSSFTRSLSRLSLKSCSLV